MLDPATGKSIKIMELLTAEQEARQAAESERNTAQSQAAQAEAAYIAAQSQAAQAEAAYIAAEAEIARLRQQLRRYESD